MISFDRTRGRILLGKYLFMTGDEELLDEEINMNDYEIYWYQYVNDSGELMGIGHFVQSCFFSYYKREE